MIYLRSATFIQKGCWGDKCRTKEDIPRKKVYTTNTAEVGIYVDPALFNEMAVSFVLSSYC